jgi:hypothetical protein
LQLAHENPHGGGPDPGVGGRAGDPSPVPCSLPPAGFQEDVLRREERTEERDRLEAAEPKKLPPGTVVWREGKELVAGADGTLEEVPR